MAKGQGDTYTASIGQFSAGSVTVGHAHLDHGHRRRHRRELGRGRGEHDPPAGQRVRRAPVTSPTERGARRRPFGVRLADLTG